MDDKLNIYGAVAWQSVNACKVSVETPSEDPVVSLIKKRYTHYIVQVGSMSETRPTCYIVDS